MVPAPASRPRAARPMRIIGGRHRGLTLAALGAGDAGGALRPTSDRVRESLFNLLAHGDYGARPRPRAGACSTSSPAPARSASRRCRAAPPRHLRRQGRRRWRCSAATSAGMAAEDAARVISRDATRLGRNHGAASDLVFLDPPYARGLGERAIASALAGGWVAPGGARRLGGGRQPCAAARLDPARPAPLWRHDDRDLPLAPPPCRAFDES